LITPETTPPSIPTNPATGPDGVAECTYRATDCAEVDQATLLKAIGRGTRRGLQKALHALRDRGHVRIEERNRTGKRNRYWPAIFAEGEATMLVEGANRGSHPPSELSFAEGADGGSQEVRTAIRTRPLKTSEEPSEKNIDQAFDAWWLLCPRKVAKGAARKAYARAIKSGRATPDELTLGMMRYAAERTGQDEQFTKHPATWLNGDCWMDEPRRKGPVRGRVIDAALRAAAGGGR
jgi:hypothetical protein